MKDATNNNNLPFLTFQPYLSYLKCCNLLFLKNIQYIVFKNVFILFYFIYFLHQSEPSAFVTCCKDLSYSPHLRC